MKNLLSRRVSGVKPPATREMTRLGNELARKGDGTWHVAKAE